MGRVDFACICAVFALAACTAKVDLAGPRRLPSAVVHTESTSIMTDGKVTFASVPLPTTASLTMVDVTVTELAVTKSGLRAPEQYRLTTLADRSQGSIHMPSGETRSQDHAGPFAGRTQRMDWTGKVWQRSLEGAPPGREQQKFLNRPWNPPDLYPHEPQRPGDGWTLTPTQLRELVADEEAEAVTGNVRATFERGVRCNGGACAVISLAGTLHWQTRDDTGDVARLTWQVRGHRLRNLTTFVEERFELHGMLRSEGRSGPASARIGTVFEGLVAESGRQAIR